MEDKTEFLLAIKKHEFKKQRQLRRRAMQNKSNQTNLDF